MRPGNRLFLGQGELPPRAEDGGAADLDPLELLGRAVRPREERRGPADFDALRDLDLLAEADAPVSGEVNGARPGRRARGRILGDAPARREHAGAPLRSLACEAVDAEHPGHVEPRADV